jgi:hypothetical protein
VVKEVQNIIHAFRQIVDVLTIERSNKRPVELFKNGMCQFITDMFQFLDMVSNCCNFLSIIRFCETGVDCGCFLEVVGGLFKVGEELVVLG